VLETVVVAAEFVDQIEQISALLHDGFQLSVCVLYDVGQVLLELVHSIKVRQTGFAQSGVNIVVVGVESRYFNFVYLHLQVYYLLLLLVDDEL